MGSVRCKYADVGRGRVVRGGTCVVNVESAPQVGMHKGRSAGVRAGSGGWVETDFFPGKEPRECARPPQKGQSKTNRASRHTGGTLARGPALRWLASVGCWKRQASGLRCRHRHRPKRGSGSGAVDACCSRDLAGRVGFPGSRFLEPGETTRACPRISRNPRIAVWWRLSSWMVVVARVSSPWAFSGLPAGGRGRPAQRYRRK